MFALMQIMQVWILEFGMQYKQWDVKTGTWIIHMEHGVKTVESGEHGVSAV